MKKQAGIWLVVGFLALAAGLVYALSTNAPPERDEASRANGPEIVTSGTTVASSGNQNAGASPDLTKVDPYQYLDPVTVGKKAPDFAAKTADGTPIKLSQFHGRKNLVLVFYQGSFCSVCGAQLTNIQSHIADFKAQDAEILAISADDTTHAAQTVGEHGLTFPVIPDAGKKIIGQYGIGNIVKKGIAYPSLFVVDKKGVVRLSFASPEGHRMHSNEILPVLAKITGKPAPRNLTYDN